MAFTNNYAPNLPVNPTPTNGEPNIDYSSEIVLHWDCDDPEGHELKYDVYLGEGEVLGLYSKGLDDTNCIVTGFRPETGYFWKVVATDGQAVKDGPVWTFATKPAKIDLNNDGRVNFGDFARLANVWMNSCSEPNWCESCDFDKSGLVDTKDLWLFSENWLRQYSYSYTVENLTQLTNGSLHETEPAFNTEGTKIVYRNFHDPYSWDNCDIWTMDIDGANKTQITTDSRGEFAPSFVPNGRITYTKEFGSNDYDIWMVEGNGDNPQSFISGDYRQSNAKWDSNGSKVVYMSEYQYQGPAEIWVANADGTGKTKLTDHTADGYCQVYPVFSHSGNFIAYANYATSDAKLQIWIMNANGSGKQQITFDPEHHNPMFWWPDDSRIGYIHNGKVWLYNLSTASSEVLFEVPSGSLSGWCDLSQNGSKLVFDWSDGSGTHIWIGDVVCEP